MNVPRLDTDVIARRLRLLRDTLDELTALRGVTAARLETAPLERAAAERLLQVAVDLAIDINAHVAVALSGRAPATGRESFLAMGTAGVLPVELAEQLAPAAGLRNVLVHRYVDISLELVARAVPEVLDGLGAYVEQVATFLASRSA
ncbi:type VII toxin-antitoxin system HepT family RNase toxin [Rhabdothermincola sediminis]|uniref:type VII toxin-antitoxin system HepT family RNase toxin n=1 Tax=Rhabdothermincola sediminis TaxID=2751370 RepID=UPI001AA06C54|nr:DUF86 domain-containing protein [Rhabdothermincola sediminis]